MNRKKINEARRLKRNAAQERNAKLLRAYRITQEEFEELLRRQDGVCAICKSGEPGGRGRFVVDHDHVTKKIRGLLCNWCNTGLGSFRDSSAYLKAAQEYLLGRRIDM